MKRALLRSLKNRKRLFIQESKLNFLMGNRLTMQEKEYRLNKLQEEIGKGWVDEEIIPFLERINAFPFIVTTQSCCGHNEDPATGRHAHIDFRCTLTEQDTIDKILRPFSNNWINSDVTLMLEANRVRYVIWLDNKEWTEQLESFIEVLETIK